jgi:hypothetical protein
MIHIRHAKNVATMVKKPVTIPTIKAIFVSVFEEPVSFGDALGVYGGCVV